MLVMRGHIAGDATFYGFMALSCIGRILATRSKRTNVE